jgi:sugar phosphate isomerase/epimerase
MKKIFLWSFVFCILSLVMIQKSYATIDFYKNVRIREIPIAVQCWTFHKFSFFESLEKIHDLGVMYVEAYPGQPLGSEFPDAQFGHTMTKEQVDQVKRRLKEYGMRLIAYGVVGFINDEESMRRVFDFAKIMGIPTIVTEPAYDDYKLINAMVQEYGIQVAIHNHPEPNKYARPETVMEHVRGLDPRIGGCCDTGHWMRSGVNPVEALRLLRGRIIHLHLKDLDKFGTKNSVDVPFGSGKANVHDILAELTLQDYRGYITIEHENPKELLNPSPSIKKGIEYIHSITYYRGYEEILGWSWGNYSKHGWNHYGPGYFELDTKTGILKSQGGMGLFWFARKMYKDFILELDYKCAQINTNSGIFVRIPGVPVSDDYIYHSFEVQIYDAGNGIHITGAIYDAEPPRINVFRETGEWNHYKITMQMNHISVELNDILILDWEMEPRGKVKDFAREGFIGLQNHDSISPVFFKNIFVKEL